MKKIIILIAMMLCCSAPIFAQQLKAYSADKLMQRASSKDTLYIINFWATWCIPCVKELPQFETLQTKYAGKPVKILLVSLDFKEDYAYKLPEFIRKKKLTPEVVWLSETNPNIFIPKIDDSWQGSIPATLILQPGKSFRKFMEGSISADEVSGIVDKQLGG